VELREYIHVICNNYPRGPHLATAFWPCIYLLLILLAASVA